MYSFSSSNSSRRQGNAHAIAPNTDLAVAHVVNCAASNSPLKIFKASLPGLKTNKFPMSNIISAIDVAI
jgi:hypothetical protein